MKRRRVTATWQYQSLRGVTVCEAVIGPTARETGRHLCRHTSPSSDICPRHSTLRSTLTPTPWRCAVPPRSGDPTRVRPAEESSRALRISAQTGHRHPQLLTRLSIMINRARPPPTRDSQLGEYSVTIDIWTRDFKPCWILHILCLRGGKLKSSL